MGTLIDEILETQPTLLDEILFESSSSGVNLPMVHLITTSPVWRSKGSRARQLNEPGQPAIRDPSKYYPSSNSQTLIDIVDWLDVGNSWRYQAESGKTYCNIYAYDYCTFAGAYLPRVWWQSENRTPTSTQIANPKYGDDVREMSANDLFKWFSNHSYRYWWVEIRPKGDDFREIQNLANEGHVLILVLKNPSGHGHVLAIIPESHNRRAKVENGRVTLPVHSQAGAVNFSYNDLDPRSRNNKASLFNAVVANNPNVKIYLTRVK